MTSNELQREVSRLRRILADAARRAAAYDALIDKLTAAQLQVDLLMKKLREER